MTERIPHAIESPHMQIAKALVAVGEIEEWYNLTVSQAVGLMMAASNGSLNPREAADVFREAVKGVGLEPLEGLPHHAQG